MASTVDGLGISQADKHCFSAPIEPVFASGQYAGGAAVARYHDALPTESTQLETHL
jgi:hypothetical protein